MKLHKVSLIAVLALGGLVACANLASAQQSSNGAPRRGPNLEQRMDRLTTELKLTDEQKPKVKKVLEASQKKMQELRADTSLSREERGPKMRAIRQDEQKQLKAILTPDQYEKLQSMPRGRRGGAQGQGGQSNAKPN
jgi:protein CpxP